MTGVVVNAGAIIVFSLIGCFLVRRIPLRIEEHIKKALGLAIIFVGIKGALENQNVLLLIMSMAIGAALGEIINIDKGMNLLGAWVEKKLRIENNQTEKKSFSKGFVCASILFCSGSMAIVGSLQSGLQGNHEILFAKSILDGVLSLLFGASLGIGTLFSALPVFIYQGSIAIGSSFIREYLSEDIIREMSSVGSLIVASIGFNFLGVKEIKVANFIPAMFIPLLWLTLMPQ
jgi:uncharacterized membrane protein YqgA involved in biofilm formation